MSEQVQPSQRPRKTQPVVDADADPQNENWLRIIEQQRRQSQGPTTEEQARDQIQQAAAKAVNPTKAPRPARRPLAHPEPAEPAEP